MPYEVFISYSKPDKVVADAVCGTLEAQGARCWIAPRDVEPGCEWSASIVKALGVCRVMVLVFSSHANESPHVRREVQRAFGNAVTVIPFRVENVRPVESLEYYLGPVHWLDALTTPLEKHLQQLAVTVLHLLSVARAAAEPDTATSGPAPVPVAKPPAPPPPLPVRPPPAPPAEVSTRTSRAAEAEPVPAMAAPSGLAVPVAERRQRSPWVTLGVAALAALTIVGVAFAVRWERPRTAVLEPEPMVPTEAMRRHSGDVTAPVVAGSTESAALRTDETTALHPVYTVSTDAGSERSANPQDLDAFIDQGDTPTGETPTITSTGGIPPEILRQMLAQGRPGTVVETRMVMRNEPVPSEETAGAADGGGPTAGAAWTIPALNLEMIHVRPGMFRMGSPAGERQRQNNEGPLTRVTLTEGFWLGKYEVTLGQWLALMHVPTNTSSQSADEETPVELVTWSDAMEFCQALNARERAAHRLPAGFAYTLPTEAQWEYACRAGTTTPFHYGGRLGANDANFDGAEPYGGAAPGQSSDGLIPVGNYPPNAWGFFDMHGNAWEWTASGATRQYPGGAVDDYDAPATGGERVLRGGSWQDPAATCRSAMRTTATENVSMSGYGFRLALAPVR